MRTLILAMFAAMPLAACGEATSSAAAPQADEVSAGAPAGPQASPAPTLTPNSDGLIASGARLAALPFGTPQAELVSVVNSVLGPPLAENENPDCPTGPATQIDWKGLSATLQNGTFQGWLTNDGTLKTASGLSAASTRSEIEAGPGYRLDTESSLDNEFSVDGVGGFYKAGGPKAGVDQLFAGDNCFAS